MGLKQYLTADNTHIKTQKDFFDYVKQNGYDIENYLDKTRVHLKNKRKNFTDDTSFYEAVLREYATQIKEYIFLDYNHIMNDSVKNKISNLTSNIKILKKENAIIETDSYCLGERELHFVPEMTGKSDSVEIALTLMAALIHEIHHILTVNRKKDKFIEVKIDKNIIGYNQLGVFFDEGVVDYSSLQFAKKHDLFMVPSYPYILNVEFVKQVMKKLNIDNPCELWNHPYDEILSNSIFEKEDLVEYNQFEEEYMIRYALGTEKYHKWKEKQQLLEQRKQLEKQKEEAKSYQLQNEGPKRTLKKKDGFFQGTMIFIITGIVGILLACILIK